MVLSPKVAASLSLPGSCFILVETLLDYQESRRTEQRSTTPMQRALAGMSLVDILSSLAWFIGTWAAPEDSGALYATGNQNTCRAQGFLLQVAIGAPLYNAALILYYILTIKYNWTSQEIFRIEPWIHAFIWIWCIGTSIVALGRDLVHYIGPICWIADPPECWLEQIPDGVKCGAAKKYSTFMFCVPLWVCILATIYGLVAIFLALRTTVHRMSTRTIAGQHTNVMRRSVADVRAVALRAVLYSLAFILTWTASTIWSVAQWFDHYPFWISYIWTLMEPLQGFWNVLIFLNNRPQSREKLARSFKSLSRKIFVRLADAGAAPPTSSDGKNRINTSDRKIKLQSEHSSTERTSLSMGNNVALHTDRQVSVNFDTKTTEWVGNNDESSRHVIVTTVDVTHASMEDVVEGENETSL